MNKRKIMTNRLNTILRGTVASLLLGTVSILLPLPAAAVDLMHNSRDTASTKWGGNWGVAGGRYGQFTCATCHEPNTKPNIKNVRAVISVMNPVSTHLLPNGLKSVTVSYKNSTSQGNDRDSHTASSRICEVCHSQTQYHRYNSSTLADKTHPDPKDGGTVCTSCHKHNTGFKGACGGCHGNPPITATEGGDDGLIGTPRPSKALKPSEAGSHATHDARNMVCDTCHYINNGGISMPNLSNSIDIGFFGFGGKVTSGTFVPYSGADRGYRFVSGTANTTIATAVITIDPANRCLNVYCHGGGVTVGGSPVKPPLTGGTNTTPDWDAPSGTQNVCGSCHGTTAAAPPTTGGHLKHAGAANGYSFSCDLCHPGIDMAHVQGNLRWRFNPSDPRTAGAKYRPSGFGIASSAGFTGDLAPSAAFGECSNLRCHGDGRGGAGYVASPLWGGSLPADCIGCHGNNATTANPISAKGHKAHTNNSSDRFGGFNFACEECHSGMVDQSGMTVTNRTLHVNGTGDVAWGPKSSGGLAYASSGCSQIYCHSNGQGTYKAPPTTWNNITDGAQGNINCDYCHGGLATDASPVASMRHPNHIGAGPLPHRPITCNWCHSNTVAADGTSVYNGTTVRHINRSIEVSFIKLATYSGSYEPSNKRCTNTYCHATGTTSSRDWDTATLNTCGNCHEANNSSTATAKLSDAHRKHYNSATRPSSTTYAGWDNINLSVSANVFMCGTCHPGNPAASHVNGPPTGITNGSVAEVALRLPFTPPVGAERAETITRGTGVNYDGRGYGYSTGTTCDTYCHSDGRGGAPKAVMSWAVSAASCGNCHNKYGDTGTSVSWSGNHSKHLAGGRSANASCNACHAATADSNTSLIANRRDRHPNGFRNVTGNSVTRALRWNSSTQQCTNTYCHFGNVMTWGGAPLPAGCTGCHGGLATSDTPMVTKGHKAHVDNDSARFGGFFFSCADCHVTTTSTNDTITDPLLHANGTANVAWGARAGGTGTLAYTPGASCTVYCHSNGAGVFRGQPKTWNNMTQADEGLINCDYCHNGLATDSTAISSGRHTNHLGSGPLPHRPIQCNACHSTTVAADGTSVYNGTGVKHINRAIDVSFVKMANFSGIYATGRVCTNTYCHGNNTTTSVRDWDTATINTCGNCHEANNSSTATTKLSDAHRKHYNTSTRPNSTTYAGWDNTNLSSTNNVFNCGVCHPANPTSTHLNGPPAGVTNGSVAEVVIRLPFSVPNGASRPETITRGTGVTYDGRGYGYSTGTTCDTYCHSNGRGGAPTIAGGKFVWTATAATCGDCHNKASDSPTATTWSKPHNKHANTYGNGGTVGSYNTTSNNTNVTCAACHASTAANNTSLLSGTRAKHPNGFRNISASTTVGSAAFRWDPANNQCKNGYCHSRAYSFSDYSTPWIKWSETEVVGCGSCHTAYPTGPDYASGYKGKANSHPKHAVFWGFTCDWCHNQTTTTGSSITNVRNHVNKGYNVVANSTKAFIGRTNTFTASNNTNPPTVKTTCSAVNCHGGNASKVFIWGGTNKCGDCHLTTAADVVNYGFSKTPTSIANINSAEWRWSGHGKASGNYDVTGVVFAGFSAAASPAGNANPGGDPCLYCHEYDAVPHGTAANPLRLRNFSHATWGKNGVCLVCHATNGATGVQPAAGYTLKSASRKVDKYHAGGAHTASLNGGQFCWDCHDAHGDRASATDGRPIAMIHKKPAKASNATTGVPTFFTATTVRFTARATGSDFVSTSSPYRGICNVCHDYNNTTGSGKMVHYTATSSDGHESGNLCTTCHTHSGTAAYDGTAYAAPSNCNSCHDYDTVGSIYSAGVWSGGYWGKNSKDGLTPNEGWGAHAKHINYIKSRLAYTVALNAVGQTYGQAGSDGAKVCGTCHSNNIANHTVSGSTARSINFGDSAFSMNGFSLLFGTNFPTQNPKYNGVSGTSRLTTPKTCSNISCHYFTTPNW